MHAGEDNSIPLHTYTQPTLPFRLLIRKIIYKRHAAQRTKLVRKNMQAPDTTDVVIFQKTPLRHSTYSFFQIIKVSSPITDVTLTENHLTCVCPCAWP
jgi:hypothetical protein